MEDMKDKEENKKDKIIFLNFFEKRKYKYFRKK